MLSRGVWIVGWTLLGLIAGIVTLLLITNAVTSGAGNNEMSQGIIGSLAMLLISCPAAAILTLCGLAVGIGWNHQDSLFERRGSRRHDPAVVGAWLGAAAAGALLVMATVVAAKLSPGGGDSVLLVAGSVIYGPAAILGTTLAGAAVGWWIGRRRRVTLGFYRGGSTACIRCGYDLVGTLGIDCPECGHRIPPEQCRHLDRVQAQQRRNP